MSLDVNKREQELGGFLYSSFKHTLDFLFPSKAMTMIDEVEIVHL